MKTLKIRLLTTLLGLGLPLACSVSGPLREDAKADGYRLGALPATWKPQGAGAGADVVYYHAPSKALISVNSVCDRYIDSSLETLSQDLLSPLKSAKVLGQNDLQISGRRALHSSVLGSLDGVPVNSELIVLRKNRCLFDFSLFGTKVPEAQKQEFLNFVRAFRFQESQ